ncbi:claudin-34-like [Electrophorus electricus]|uniref:claudin-34-like n=1 Tax=Electrophorus electricus TaxID=8005 RepID=UPI0015D0A8FC|nr:claudin-34-like [Electrophorus electricus]
MPYLVHTAHAQFVAFWVGVVGWILTIVAVGLVEWRVWEVSDLSVITSGLAFVGIWRACFFTHVLPMSENQVMYCQRMHPSDTFTPSEIVAAQPLMLLAFLLGLFANSSIIYGLRNVYFGLDKRRPITLAFSFGGGLLILTGVISFIPLFWNLNSVLTNQTIDFPPNFYMPPAPVQQSVGPGIAVGIFASILEVVSGVVFVAYRFPEGLSPRVTPCRSKAGCPGLRELRRAPSLRPTPTGGQGQASFHGIDNLAFQSQENG